LRNFARLLLITEARRDAILCVSRVCIDAFTSAMTDEFRYHLFQIVSETQSNASLRQKMQSLTIQMPALIFGKLRFKGAVADIQVFQAVPEVLFNGIEGAEKFRVNNQVCRQCVFGGA